jgi:hypothetical protein
LLKTSQLLIKIEKNRPRVGWPEKQELDQSCEVRFDVLAPANVPVNAPSPDQHRPPNRVCARLVGDKDPNLSGITLLVKSYSELDVTIMPTFFMASRGPAASNPPADDEARNIAQFGTIFSFPDFAELVAHANLPSAVTLTFLFWASTPTTPEDDKLFDFASRALDGRDTTDVRFYVFSRKHHVDFDRTKTFRPLSIFANSELLIDRCDHFATSASDLIFS